MDNYNSLSDAIASYAPAPTDLLRYLRSQRKYNSDEFCTDEQHEYARQYFVDEFWGNYHSEVPRDEDGVILVEKAFEWTKQRLDDFYAESELAPFVRTMARTEIFKEELMMVVWHPKRIERLLELGEDVLDNFAGL
jgi:hypothetical protein